MTIEKLPSGSYRIRKQYNKKKYTVIVPYKPSQKEALQLIAKEVENSSEGALVRSETFEFYALKFLSEKEDLSPTTYEAYESILRNLSPWFKGLIFPQITNDDIQKEIDEYKKTRSPKTVKNGYGFISSVFAEYRPEFNKTIELPSVKKKVRYEPTTKEIGAILKAAEGTRYEIPLLLAVLGLRRGEICAITSNDLSDDNVLTISKAVALKNHKYIIKSTKTEESIRRIPIPKMLADMIRENGCAYDGYPGKINQHLHKLQDRLGIGRFNLHTLRHFSAAYLHKMGFTEEQIMEWHGWSNPDTMKMVYRYNLDPAESRALIATNYETLMTTSMTTSMTTFDKKRVLEDKSHLCEGVRKKA